MLKREVFVFSLLLFAVTNCACLVIKNNCPNNFEVIGSKCYYLEKVERVTWETANKRCVSRDAKLLSIESAEEMTSINAYLEAHGFTQRGHPDGFWTSGNDLENEGDFYWAGTGKEITYAHWYPHGDPNNWGGNENCVQLWYQDTWYMNDLDCEFRNKYICEINKETSEIPQEITNESTEANQVNVFDEVKPIGFWASIARFFKRIIDAIIEFFANLFNMFE